MSKRLIYEEDAIDALGEKPLVWDDLSDFDLGKAAQWADDVDAIKDLPSAQPQDIARDIATIIENEKDMRVMLQQRWISVTDRLPEENKEVLICTDDGLLYIAEHEYLFDRVYWEETTEYRTVENVVAWMPLPEPYKGEEE